MGGSRRWVCPAATAAPGGSRLLLHRLFSPRIFSLKWLLLLVLVLLLLLLLLRLPLTHRRSLALHDHLPGP